MGATEILRVLKKDKELTSKEIAEKLKANVFSIKHVLKKLVKDISEDVNFRQLSMDEKEERYGSRLGGKIYVYWLSG